MIVITTEIEELKAQAEGHSPFVENPTYEALAELDMAEYRKLDAETRLALGYYVAAKARGCQPESLTPAREKKAEEEESAERV
jgi:hypothetical protein